MSHTTSIGGIKIANIDALEAAIAELANAGIKCSLVADSTPRAYFKDQQGMGRADYVIKLDNSRYDIGLYKQEDGSYEPRTDFWGGDVAKLLGGTAGAPEREQQAQLGKLFQMYGVHAATLEARRSGKMVRRVNDDVTGQIKLVVTGF